MSREMLLRVFLVLGGVLGRALCADYNIPEITIEAFEPKGFRVSIPDEPGIHLFAFHGNVNRAMGDIEPGEFSMDVKTPVNGYWTYDEPNKKLDIGDELTYWVFVQHNRLGYRKENKWKVKAYSPMKSLKCDISRTAVPGKKDDVCQNQLIFQENFGDIDQSRWIIEQYIPMNGPNYEFNTYENKPETVVADGMLRIRPILREEDEIKGKIDLALGCTSNSPQECFAQYSRGPVVLQPARSGKIRSKFSFTFGKIEVRAQLPAGDWIFPEIALTPVDQLGNRDPPKIWIAYSRGNKELIGAGNDDIGGTFLFAGEVQSAVEPKRSESLVSSKGDEPFSKRMHVYTLLWKPGVITAFVDNVQIGERTLTNNFEKCVISLGVGVGGNNDFPDGYKSGERVKPWKNRESRQHREFFAARNDWFNTWNANDTQLKVDYIKIYAI